MQNGCANLGLSPNDSDEQIEEIRNAIQQVAEASLVDHRFILATILQEVRDPRPSFYKGHSPLLTP